MGKYEAGSFWIEIGEAEGGGDGITEAEAIALIESYNYITIGDVLALNYTTMADVLALNYVTLADVLALNYITLADVLALGYIDDTEVVPLIKQNGYQPEHPPSSSVVTKYMDAAGNDTTGDGSIGLPYLTMRRAETDLAQFPIAQNVINAGAGTFDLSGYFPTCGVTIQGTLTAGSIATISSVTSASHNTGTVVVVTGLNATNNSLAGTMIKYTSGPANGIYGYIDGNTATAGGNTTLYISHGQGSVSYTAPVSTNTIQLYTHSTIFSGQPSFRGGGITFQDCAFTGTSAQLVGISPATAMTFNRCKFTGLGAINHTGGNVTLTTCYLGLAGNSLRGVWRSTAGLATFSSGCVVSGASAGTNNYMLFQKGVNVEWAGNTIVRSLRGIRFEGSDSVISTPGTFNTIVFETKDVSNTGGIQVNTDASGNGVGGNVYLPHLRGQISGNWAVDARKNAVVWLGTSSSLVAVQGTNAVTVDGTTLSAWEPEGTIIYNGNPAQNADDIAQIGTVDVLAAAGTVSLGATGLVYTGAAANVTLRAGSAWVNSIFTIFNGGTGTVTIVRGGTNLFDNGAASITVAAGAKQILSYASSTGRLYRHL